MSTHFAPLWRWPLGLIALISLWRLMIASALPVTQDEAYYFDWARTLAWGYFDHPPGVALLGLGTLLAPGSALAARLGNWLVATLTLLVLWRLFRRCGLRDSTSAPGTLTLALVLASASLSGFAAGVLTTPDTALALGWVLALHEGLAALSGQRWRWLTTGAAVGLGLLGKYTMLLSGPVFLWAILAADPGALRTRWPYLGALIALLVFSPNLLWNAQHDWLSLRFQFGHGFSTDIGSLHLATDAISPTNSAMTAWSQPVASEPNPGARVASVIGFAGTQLALLGWLLLPLASSLVQRIRRQPMKLNHPASPALTQPAQALLTAAALFPLLLFAAVASFSEVEPNWPAMYLPAAAALLALWFRPKPQAIMVAALANLLMLTVYTFHASTTALPFGDSQNRILRETHGFAELAERVADLQGPVFADRYQLAAMLNFHQHRNSVSQWPGITRASEYSRGEIAPQPDSASLDQSGFWLIASLGRPLEIPGFVLTAAEAVADCAGHPLFTMLRGPSDPTASPQTAQTHAGYQNIELPCPHLLHMWWITHYQSDSH